MTEAVSLEMLKEIPFLDQHAFWKDGVIVSLDFFVKGEWHLWIATGDQLHKIKGWPHDASYFGDAKDRVTDQCFPIFDLLSQRLLTTTMLRQFSGMGNDFQCLGASLGKLRPFFDAHRLKEETRRFVQTELEYVVMVCRGVFDLLQEIVAAVWDRIMIHGQARKRHLPHSFADVVLKSNQRRTAAEIANDFVLPMPFAEWYEQQGPFFELLRDFRNRMAHGGSISLEMLFCTDRGFAMQRGPSPYCRLYQWPESVELPNRLVPLRPVFCSLIKQTLNACDSFTNVLSSCITLPGELFPGLRYYSRGLHDTELSQLDLVLEKSLWCDGKAALEP